MSAYEYIPSGSAILPNVDDYKTKSGLSLSVKDVPADELMVLLSTYRHERKAVLAYRERFTARKGYAGKEPMKTPGQFKDNLNQLDKRIRRIDRFIKRILRQLERLSFDEEMSA